MEMLDETSQKTKRSKFGTSQSGRGPPGPKQSDAIVPINDGRKCNLCGAPDTEPDPVVPEESRYWLYPRAPSGKNSGFTCFYCGKGFEGRYKKKGYSITQFKNDLGKDDIQYKIFIQIVRVCEQKCIEHNTRHMVDIRVEWQQEYERAEEAVLSMVDQTKLEMIEPEDEWLPVDVYVKKHGNPSENSHLGHKELEVKGKNSNMAVRQARPDQEVHCPDCGDKDKGSRRKFYRV